jgi:hypothetical protein
MANALRRLGLDLAHATEVLDASAVAPATRAEDLGLEAFARVTESLLARGWRP